MATGNIKKDPKPIYFNCTRDSQLISGGCYGYYHPNDRSVIILVSFSADHNITSGSTLFTIPEEYRPAGNVYGVCMLMDLSGEGSVGDLHTNASGILTQRASNARRFGIGVIEYVLS